MKIRTGALNVEDTSPPFYSKYNDNENVKLICHWDFYGFLALANNILD